jgi:hypothetical protein
MDLETYDGLKEAIADALMRDDLADQIPLFIKLAETSIFRSLRISDMETVAYATSDENGEVGLPTDFIELIDVRTGSNTGGSLEPINLYQQMRDYGLSSGGVGSRYVVTGNTLSTFPVSSDDTITIVYYAKPPALDAGNQTNWLLTKAPDVYLWGSLKASAPWLEDDARIQVWEGLYQQALKEVRGSDELRIGNTMTRVYLPHE